MPDSIREQLLANVRTTLLLITVAGGYSVNIGTVSRGHLSPLETFSLPSASILPVTDRPEYGAGVLRRVLTFTVRVWIDTATLANVGTVLEGVIADVERVLRVDSRRAGLAEDTREGEGGVQYIYLASTETLAGADLHVDVDYKTSIASPLVGG